MKEFKEKLIEKLYENVKSSSCPSESCWEHSNKDCDKCSLKKIMISDVIQIVNQLAEEYNNGWIPCSERFPEENEFVISSIHPSKSVNGGNPVIISVYNSVSASYWNDGTIQAWMPLPTPYQKGE